MTAMARPFYIDQDACIGDGSCADICPGCISFEPGGTAMVMRFDCDEKLIEEAMEMCPVRCIHWEKDEADKEQGPRPAPG
jgi:ferredoxin